MPTFRDQVKSRVSLFYLGSALFFGTGVVAIADQPLNNHKGPGQCTGCTPNRWAVPCDSRSVVCTGGHGPTTCLQCLCDPTPANPSILCRP